MAFRRLLVVCLVVFGLGAVPTIGTSAGASGAIENNQVPIEDHPQSGSLHIIADDTLEPEVADPPSVLFPSSAWGGALDACSSASTGACAGKTSLEFVAHLPACDATITVDCISGVSATDAQGSAKDASLSGYFPDRGPHSFVGDPAIKLPSGRAPSVWSIPSAPHAGGTDYAVVARLRGSTSNRKAAAFQIALTPVSEKKDAHTNGSYEPPRWVEPGRMAAPASDRGRFRCAYWGDNGSCLLSRDFPKDFTYAVSVRLAEEPAGWLHGRIDSPTITFEKDGSVTVVTVKAKPVQVPAFQVARQFDKFPTNVQTAYRVDGPYGEGGSRQPGGQYLKDPAQRNAEYTIRAFDQTGFDQIELLNPVLEDKATYAPWIWRVRTLDTKEMTNAGKCLTTGDGVKGLVTTNATVYGSGPPAYNSSTASLDYKVAALHYLPSGEKFKGSYTMMMRSTVARCIYNFKSAPMVASISVIEEDGSVNTAATSVREVDGWLTLSASGFTHSAPILRVSISQEEVAAAPLSLKPRRALSATKIAKEAGLVVSRKSRVRVVRAPRYSKQCKISGTRLVALKPGTCVVNVTVTTAGKTTKGSVTVEVK